MGSVRETWSAWGSEMGCLGTAACLDCSSCTCSGRKHAATPPAHLLESYTSVYQKCRVLSLYSTMIPVPCTTQTPHLLPHPSPGQGHLCFKMGQQKRRLCFCHISPSSSSLSSLQTSAAAQQSCVSGIGASMGNEYGIRIPALTV